MRHRSAGRHLGRDTAHRTHMYRNLVTDLLRYERISTTEAKAKEIRPLAEKIITLGKRGDLHARRQAAAYLYDTKVVKKVFDEVAPRMRDRPGGYLRITAIESRKGDGAKMANIELVDLNGLVAMPRPQRVTAAPTAAHAAAATAAPAAVAVAEPPAETDAPIAEVAEVAEAPLAVSAEDAVEPAAEVTESAVAAVESSAEEAPVAPDEAEAGPAADSDSPRAEGGGA